jgi:hypothetical protein
MPDVMLVNQPWCASVVFVAGDASKTIKAAQGAGKRLVITQWYLGITTAAAQAFDLEDDGSTPVEIFKFPVSLAVGIYPGPKLDKGIILQENQALVYKPTAAGPAGCFIVEGYVIGT